MKNLENWLNKLVKNKIFWVLLISFSFFTPIIRSVNRPLPPPPPSLFSIAEFNLIDENGKEFSSKELSQKFSIIHFHFAKCPTICPKLLETTRTIEKRIRGLGQSAIILSVSVDPSHDQPSVLFELARKHKANPFVWKFLTGSPEQIERFVADFKQPKLEKLNVSSGYDIAHSGSYFVLDKKLNVRGIYSNDKNGINKMMIDIGLLVNRI
jgi:protein SCO1/2